VYIFLYLQWAKIVLPHIGLIVLSGAYVFAGAIAFFHLEQPHEHNVRQLHVAEVNGRRYELFERIMTHLRASNESSKGILYASIIINT
jgi:hypothetical protein